MVTGALFGLTWLDPAASRHAQAAEALPPLGVEIAFLVASMATAVFAVIVAMEMKRSPVVWAAVGFFAVFIVANGVHAML